jgi:hypothetical protein
MTGAGAEPNGGHAPTTGLRSVRVCKSRRNVQTARLRMEAYCPLIAFIKSIQRRANRCVISWWGSSSK